ncbi:YqzL family protein [Cohnella pontilimi]|uniref:YqzL family protein n=1 Tax=Cohnella pontilimi TaxID=2564100 RepID=A0A4U0FF16_9BACL|nr:YqzL family protein [Cohnella pontilimi]TJY43418.1 YqzL family protein [Cohnella pontilimi]
MRDFTWHVFRQTGDIEAYLLYKEMDKLGSSDGQPEGAPEQEDGGSAGEAVPS